MQEKIFAPEIAQKLFQKAQKSLGDKFPHIIKVLLCNFLDMLFSNLACSMHKEFRILSKRSAWW